MFLRIATKAMTHRRSRLAVSIMALVLGSTITTALLSVYHDAGRKMSRELRAYGPNIMVGPKEGASLDQSVMDRIVSDRWPAEIVAAAPFLYLVAQVSKAPGTLPGATASTNSASSPPASQPVAVVVAGTWLDQSRAASPWRRVNGSWLESHDDERDCLVGTHLASRLSLNLNDRIDLFYGDDEAARSPTAEKGPAQGARKSLAASQPHSREPGRPVSARATLAIAGILDTGG